MDDLAEGAAEAARAAAERGGVEVRDLDPDAETLRELADLFDEVWGRDRAVMPANVLVAMGHAGHQLTGAYRDDELVGGTAAFLGRDDGELHVHSHITGVLPGQQGAGIGWALKQHQRAWALQRGIATVRWTFDPLVRRNAVFNLVKLGARPLRFMEDCYGPMQDEFNRGLATDRLLMAWKLDERRVQAAAAGEFHAPNIDALRGVGATEVLVDDDGTPRTAPLAGDCLLAQVPEDIEAIRAADLDRGRAWTEALRATLGAAINQGYRVTGITRDGWYVLASAGGVSNLAE